MDQNSNKFTLTEKEMEGMKEVKSMIQGYLDSDHGSKMVREFLTKVQDDEAFLYRFLKGRKFRPKHTWETIKRYAEVRFDTYPECFPAVFPKDTIPLWDKGIVGVLKTRDSKGRRIAYFNANEWDTDKYNLPMFAVVAVHIAEILLEDEDCMNNGIVFIQECSGMGMKHARQYTLQELLRFLNVFWYAFPLKLKGIYYLNVPYLLGFIYGLVKPFIPKKMKERFVLTSSGKSFDALHENISPDVLPKCLGGKLENHEACDLALANF